MISSLPKNESCGQLFQAAQPGKRQSPLASCYQLKNIAKRYQIQPIAIRGVKKSEISVVQPDAWPDVGRSLNSDGKIQNQASKISRPD
jgi:hypothetical protein